MWDNKNIISEHCIRLNSLHFLIWRRTAGPVEEQTQDICFINLLLRDKDFVFKT